MTIDATNGPVRAEDDPHLDWHSDARRIMDGYANDVCYRQIAGTQVRLLQRAADTSGGVPATEVAVLFEQHRTLCHEAGTPDRSFTRESFVGFLTSRVMLRAVSPNSYAITSVGTDFLRFIEDQGLPPKSL